MNAERILIAAECIGDAKWFIDTATAYAKDRVVFGNPIGAIRDSVSHRPCPCTYAGRRSDCQPRRRNL